MQPREYVESRDWEADILISQLVHHHHHLYQRVTVGSWSLVRRKALISSAIERRLYTRTNDIIGSLQHCD